MRKIILTLIILASSSISFAECTVEQESAEIKLEVIKKAGSVKAGGDHGVMDEIIIKAPIEVSGVPLSAMELTRGEVAEMWIPIAYELDGGIAKTKISGYSNAIKDFEIAIYYKNANCEKFIQRML